MKELAEAILASQPFSRLLGTRLERFEAGAAVLALTITPQLTQQHGFVHGGVISYLADNALTFAGGSILGDALTVELKTNYVRPARNGTTLRAIATVVGHSASQAVCRCDVFVDDLLVAAAQGTIRKAPPKGG